MVLDRDRRTMNRLGIEARMVAMGDRDFGERPRRAPGIVQIAHRAHPETLGGRGPSPTHVELIVAVGIRDRDWSAGGLPAHAPPGASVHRAKADDSLAIAGLEQ